MVERRMIALRVGRRRMRWGAPVMAWGLLWAACGNGSDEGVSVPRVADGAIADPGGETAPALMRWDVSQNLPLAQSHQIRGRVTSPVPLGSGKVWVRLSQISGDLQGLPLSGSTQNIILPLPDGTGRAFEYHIDQVPRGIYRLAMYVDRNGNAGRDARGNAVHFDDAGDLLGFFGGTVATPVMQAAAAATIELPTMTMRDHVALDQDFGLGTLP